MKKIVRLYRSIKPSLKEYLDSNFGKDENIMMDLVSYLDLYYQDWKLKFLDDDRKLPEYDIYWMVGMNDFRTSLNYYFGHLQNKKIIDDRNNHRRNMSKLCWQMCMDAYNFKTPNTIGMLISKKNLFKCQNKLIEKIWFPIVCKRVNEDRGTGVFLCLDELGLQEILSDNIGETLVFQEFISNDWDIRVIVLWWRFFGVYKRHNPNDRKNNISQGWIGQSINISDDLKSICEKLAKEYMLDIAGIDLILDKDWKYYIIEINFWPQFEWFEKTTWLNFADGLKSIINEQ